MHYQQQYPMSNIAKQVQQRCKQLHLDDKYIDQLKQKVKLFQRTQILKPAFESFFLKNHYSNDLWCYFKLMLTLDLFSLIDILYINTPHLFKFIDRLYAPHHYTSLSTNQHQFNHNDKPEQIASFLIQEVYKNTKLLQLLKYVIGLHLAIKQESLVNAQFYYSTKRVRKQVFNSQDVSDKYQIIKKIMKQIRTFIFIRNIMDNQYNKNIKSVENEFLMNYYDSSKQFKDSFNFLKLILELEQIIDQQQIWFASKDLKVEKAKLTNQQVDRINQIIKEVVDNQYFDIFQEMKFHDFKNIDFEKIDLVKFKAVQYLLKYYEIKSTVDFTEIIKLFFKLNLFKKQNSHAKFVTMGNYIEEALYKVGQKQNKAEKKEQILKDVLTLIQSEEPDSPFVQIQKIFDEVDARIAGSICSEWVEHFSSKFVNKQKRVIVIGKTGVGKSSLINFLHHGNIPIAKIAENKGSTTFYPRNYNLQNLQQDWEICDLPGFMDNRSFIHKLCVCFFLNFIIQKSSDLKFVFVTKYDVFESDHFKNLMKYFCTIFNCKTEYIQSLTFVFSFVGKTKEGKKKVKNEKKTKRPNNQFQEIKRSLIILEKSSKQLENFYEALLKRMFESCLFYTQNNHKQDNKLEEQKNQDVEDSDDDTSSEQDLDKIKTQNSQNRQKVFATIKSLSSVSKLEFNPIIFLEEVYTKKIKHIYDQIQKQAKSQLQGNSKNFKKFIQLYQVIETFKKSHKKQLKQIYDAQKQRYVLQYQKICHNYQELNKIPQDDRKRYILALMRQHVRKQYFKTWEDSSKLAIKSIFSQNETKANTMVLIIWKQLRKVVQTVEIIDLNLNKIRQLSSHLQYYPLNQQQREQSIFTFKCIIDNEKQFLNNFKLKLNQNDFGGFKDDLNKLEEIEIMFKQYKYHIINQKQSEQKLIQYLTLLIEVNETKLFQQIKNKIIQIQQDLLKKEDRFLKDQYRSIFKFQKHQKKFDKILECNLANMSQKIFLKILLFFKKGVINNQMLMMVDYYLQLLSRQNYEHKYQLEYKASRIIKGNNKILTTKAWRLNNYGECYCPHQVSLSDILEVNSNKIGHYYNFLEYKDIKIYCQKIKLDLQNILIYCKNSFSIFADQIEVIYDNITINIKTQKGKKATLVILEKNNSQKVYEALKMGIQRGKKLNNQESFTDETQASLVSRTLIQDGVFLEKYQKTPKYTYILKKDSVLPLKTTYLKKKVTIQKLLQFGQLHLKKTLINKINKPNNKKLKVELFESSYTILERQVIEYTITQFNKTSIKLRYQLFSKSFCDKITLLIYDYFQRKQNNFREVAGVSMLFIKNESLQQHKDKDEQFQNHKQQLLKQCFEMMKNHLHTHIYKYIMDESLRNSKFGKYFVLQSSQAYSKSVKIYCENLLSLTISQINRKFKDEESFLTLTKRFIIQFQNKILFAAQQQLSFFKKFKGFFKMLFDSATKQSEQVINKHQTHFVQQQIKKQENIRSYFMNTYSNKQNNDSFKVDQEQQSQKVTQSMIKMFSKSKYLQNSQINVNQSTTIEELKKNLLFNIYNQKYAKIIRYYQDPKERYYIFNQKLDQIHSDIAYAYLKSLNFNKVEDQLALLPSEMDSNNKTKIIYDILKLKYKIKEQKLRQKKQERVIETSTSLYFNDPYKNKKLVNSPQKVQIRHNYLLESMARRNNNNQEFYNIISFDSSKYRNNVVSFIFAAQIQKYTHRPIMHMFDAVVCKNSSAYIGSILTTPERKESTQQYQKKYFPVFAAVDCIYKCQEQIEDLSERFAIKHSISQNRLDHLDNYLVMLKEQNNSHYVFTPRNYKKYNNSIFQRPLSNVYDFCLLSVESRMKETITNPLLQVYSSEYIPALSVKSRNKINILSLGTGLSLNKPNISFGVNQQTERRWNKLDRWDIMFDQQVKMSNLKPDDYIEHARIFLEEKWINDAKEMRDLFDHLEDKGIIENY